HQDYAYFPHTNTDLVAIMVMLDDATPENGCMSFVRGSHKLGLLNHSNAAGYFTGGCLETKYWEQHPENVVPVTPRAGGISMHHSLMLHGSPPNLSGKPRRGLVIQYRAADAYALADDIWDDTGLVVSGKHGQSVRCTAGTVLLPRWPHRFGYGHGNAWNQVGEFATAVNGDKLKV
ncbi:MAG TPA: phytanoyl-CoA dioxygenase family protein, partial [Tepidisphaeraceae bacterium]|nr:phytanoyl-CoA dioxygenase family protein [Tepidisphaeraceae bacterium]